MKKPLIIIGCILALHLLPVAFYGGIVITNNVIANRMEKELKSTPLPESTVLMDSFSLAGKLVGNGNGMQYMGSILVVSHLSKEELYDYYSEAFDYVEVREQETQKIDFINSQEYSFELFGDPQHHDHYSVTCFKSQDTDDLAGILLNLDLRGY